MAKKVKNKGKAKPTVHRALKIEDESRSHRNDAEFLDQKYKEFLEDEAVKKVQVPEKTPIRELGTEVHATNYLNYFGRGMRHKKQLYAVPVPIVGKYKDGSNIYRDHHGLYIIHFQAKTRKMVKKHLKTLRRYVKH
jgi:hypothetical protein